MATSEEIEKLRQAIMRYRELLLLMRETLEGGERAYTALFSGVSPDDKATLKEKDLQWSLAEQMIGDVSDMSKAVLRLRLGARHLERDFETLYDIVVASEITE